MTLLNERCTKLTNYCICRRRKNFTFTVRVEMQNIQREACYCSKTYRMVKGWTILKIYKCFIWIRFCSTFQYCTVHIRILWVFFYDKTRVQYCTVHALPDKLYSVRRKCNSGRFSKSDSSNKSVGSSFQILFFFSNLLNLQYCSFQIRLSL